MGCSIAWRLSQHGLRVLLLDSGRLGAEASSAGAGMLAPGGEIEERSSCSDLALESLAMYPAFVAELEEETGLHIDFQRHGAVDLALTREEWRTLEERGRRQAALGIPSCPLTAHDLSQHVPMARREVTGALFYPQDALVDPRDIMAALCAACRAGGVEIREGTRVTSILPGTGDVRVQSQNETLHAAVAVLAAGAWSSQIAVPGPALPRAFPVRGHLVGYALEAHSLGPLLRRGHTYLLQRSGGFTIAGTSSEEVGFDRTLDSDIVGDIHTRAAQILPALSGCQPSERWLGFRPAVEGGRPALGRSGNTALWLAYGHYRNGILMAPASARRVAEGILTNSGMGLSAALGTP